MAEDTSKNVLVNDGFEKRYPFRIIEDGKVVLYRLSLNKKKHYVTDESQGFKFLFPVVFESKKVDVAEYPIDFIPVEIEDKNKMDIRMDMVATVKVTDAIKYYTRKVSKNTENINDMLIKVFNECLRNIVSKYPYSYLAVGSNPGLESRKWKLPAGKVIPLKKKIKEKIVDSDGTTKVVEKIRVIGICTEPFYTDPETGQWRGMPHFRYNPLRDQINDLNNPDYIDKLDDGFICDMAELKMVLDEFEEKYGLAVTSIVCNSLKPASERVQKMQEEIQAEKHKTEIEEERKKQAQLRAQAKGYELDQVFSSIERNFPNVDENARFEKSDSFMYAVGNNGNIAKETAATATAVAAGLNAANQVNNKQKNKTR